MSLRDMPPSLKAGIAMMVFALALAAVVAIIIWLRPDRAEQTSATVEPAAAQSAKQKEKTPPNRGKKLEIDDEPVGAADKPADVEDEPAARKADPLPLLAREWPKPSTNEILAANAPRYYDPQPDSTLTLTVDAIGLHEVPVINSEAQDALDRGVIHLPETPMPWDERPQKNVYLAGHRLGYEGTGSRLVFYNLDKLKKGDSIVLEDGSGTPYEYEVSEVFVAKPEADWVVDPVRGRDMVTLQTCVYPEFKNRLIVRADRV